MMDQIQLYEAHMINNTQLRLSNADSAHHFQRILLELRYLSFDTNFKCSVFLFPSLFSVA